MVEREFLLSASGGGWKGMYSLGALFRLKIQNGVSIKSAAGASVGCLIAAESLRNDGLQKMKERILFWFVGLKAWDKMLRKFWFVPNVSKIMTEMNKRALGDLSQVPDLSFYLMISTTKIINIFQLELEPNIHDFFESTEDLLDVMQASQALPSLNTVDSKPWQLYKGERFIDGGFANNMPCNRLHRAFPYLPLVKFDLNNFSHMELYYQTYENGKKRFLQGDKDMKRILQLGYGSGAKENAVIFEDRLFEFWSTHSKRDDHGLVSRKHFLQPRVYGEDLSVAKPASE